MKHPSPGFSPVAKARAAGFFWLLTILTSGFALFVGEKVVVLHNASATVANLLGHGTLFLAGTAAMLVSGACYLATTLFVYQLLRPVNETASRLMALFSFVGCAIGATSCIFELVPVIMLKDPLYSGAFSAEQLAAVTIGFLRMRVQANNIGLIFFGLHCLFIGGLILRSKFLPKAIGVLMVIAGLGWLTFLWPPLAQKLAPFNLLPGGLGELSFAGWLLIVGVNARAWNEQFPGPRAACDPANHPTASAP